MLSSFAASRVSGLASIVTAIKFSKISAGPEPSLQNLWSGACVFRWREDCNLKTFIFMFCRIRLLKIMGLLILTPIAAKALYPRLAKCGVHLSQLQRIGVGMLITTASMLCAGSKYKETKVIVYPIYNIDILYVMLVILYKEKAVLSRYMF